LANSKKTLRTCIFCRGKFEQNELLRLKCEEKEIVLYNNKGRSFYLCNSCIKKVQEDNNQKDYKRFENALCRECKNKDKYVLQLKEILADVR